MEKIQSAIARARAARSAKTASVAEGADTAASAAIADAGGQTREARAEPLILSDPIRSEAAWSAIPEFKPKAKRVMRNHIVAFDSGREAVPFDVMRTKLLQQMRANKWRRLAITSPGGNCGKTTIALNLGFSLARQPNLHTLVAEVDLRRPSIATILGIQEAHSFAKVLDGSARFEDNVLRYGQNLAFATNRVPARNPAELLHSPGVGPVLADIETRYAPDLILFDTPPMLIGDDAMAFMDQADCVLLVAAAERSTAKEIDICERELATQTNVLGVVLNKCRYMGPKYGYSYYD